MNERPKVLAAGVAIPFEDADLVERSRRGETAAFDGLIRKYQDRVFNACWRLCGSRADAEDLTQEAFVKALTAIDRFDGRSGFYTWVFRIAFNLTVSARRKQARTRTASLDRGLAGDGETDAPGRAGECVDGGDAGPDEQAATSERDRILAAALADLDEEHRFVVVMRDIESLGYDEIAEILKVPVGTVKSRLHRARLALRDALAPVLGMVE